MKAKWRVFLIAAVLTLSVQQILPTILFYIKPLKQPVSKEKIEMVQADIKQRLDLLDTDLAVWIHSFCDLLQIKPSSFKTETGGKFTLTFAKSDDAARFRSFFPQAASQLPFQGEQLRLEAIGDDPKQAAVHRAISYQMPEDVSSLFEQVEAGSRRYEELINDRKNSLLAAAAREKLDLKPIFSLSPANKIEALTNLSKAIGEIDEISKESIDLAKKIGHPIRAANQEDLLELLTKAQDELLREMGKVPVEARKSLEEKERLFSKTIQTIKKKDSWIKRAEKEAGGQVSPFIESVSVDLANNQFVLQVIQHDSKKIQALLMEEIARISNETGEELVLSGDRYVAPLHAKKGVSSLLLFHLDSVESAISDETIQLLRETWAPKHPDLQNVTIVDSKSFAALPADQKAFCFVLTKTPHHSIQIELKGMETLLLSYEKNSETEIAKTFFADVAKLSQLLASKNFHPVRSANGIFFEKEAIFSSLLFATRENWRLLPAQSAAALELSTLEDRILDENKIDTQIHEELLRWDDAYKAAQVSLEKQEKWTVVKPIRNPLWSNFCLYLKKVIRGDEKRVLKWGLDLSGGKSIQLELRDQNGKVVTDDIAIKQGINELFERVNKLGVSDVSIRQIGTSIALDFPGSDLLSGAELVKASSMSFHLVNERFGPMNPALAEVADRFLRGVWNEAISTRRTDPESIATIAHQHLYESSLPDALQLQEEGLSLHPGQDASKVVMNREVNRYHHPLMIVFAEPVLVGSNLTNIHASYDSSKGNFLSFEVSGSGPQEKLYQWTSKYSKDGVAGTPLDFAGRGRGWRMAVVFNGTVISAPSLESSLSNSASISGSFSQREVQKFASDLKAGSLTFTPKILSETSVSAELGAAERAQGIQAALVALALVIATMIFYYRFAGVVASIAVLCNLLILWAILQNMGASLSLPGIAGIILTIGMAVDANVLVFERIKEEFNKTGNIRSSILAGFEKAFSAILDSNLTTILAALVLLQFDSGPIRAFAVTMIVGIASSMFTALFMTRTYFTYWARREHIKPLSMANWFKQTKFQFLKWTKAAIGAACILTALGVYSIAASKSSILSLDFTGGYALRIDLDSPNNRAGVVENALLTAGASPSDFHVREIGHSSGVELFLGSSLEEPGKPFATRTDTQTKIDWICSSIEHAGAKIHQSIDELGSTWSTMSGQMSQTMRNQAILGIAIALAAIFVYLIFRFEARYAGAALLCLLHDLVVTVAILGALKMIGLNVQIDLTVVAALMTIVGYSLNDTIIVFDRIRENLKQTDKKTLPAIIQTSLQETLSRTAMTSGTTLLVVATLLFFGGASIFSFSLVMTIGVIVGTLSSWFIACPLLLTLSKESKFQ